MDAAEQPQRHGVVHRVAPPLADDFVDRPLGLEIVDRSVQESGIQVRAHPSTARGLQPERMDDFHRASVAWCGERCTSPPTKS